MLFYGLLRSKRLTALLLALLFLPGTIIHELAHLVAAQGLRLQTGKVSFWPKIEDKGVKLGSVEIAQSDPFRRFLVGIAPLVLGFAFIFALIKIFERFQFSGLWSSVLLFYILFQIGNTMFSSKRDMEGAAELIIAVFLVFALLYLTGFKPVFNSFSSAVNSSSSFFGMTSGILFKIIVLDIAVIFISKLLGSAIKLRS